MTAETWRERLRERRRVAEGGTPRRRQRTGYQPRYALPYARTTGRGVWWERCAPAMEAPGEWVKVGEARSQSSATSTAYMLRVGRFRVAPGVWEFAARSESKTGPWEVWARYMGAVTGAPEGEAV